MALSTSGMDGMLEALRGPPCWQRTLAECLGYIVLAEGAARAEVWFAALDPFIKVEIMENETRPLGVMAHGCADSLWDEDSVWED